ncbi:response regulator [Paraglaciecola sp. MB-3u-78]|jgi:CheY-like chemotaxis protein|uniref:response regulator n=1 Tax=Paraglaciecola sp. MB-3u-78 TaxID=2058332 RepID=UPI000C34473C|nr:response regulator [Paraglaciecola sp. MB-3u-78]PKG93240.1 two-component system response regulator [Paraglaciecola sp. MB-3u-78]
MNKPNPNDVTLFLIEDDDIDAMSIKREFKRREISSPIVRAKDGVEALELLASGKISHPFIILLDLQMPRMNGLEFLTTLRANSAYKNSVVFVLSTSQDESDIFNSYASNVAGYFIKDEGGDGFISIVDIIDGYRNVVHLPLS